MFFLFFVVLVVIFVVFTLQLYYNGIAGGKKHMTEKERLSIGNELRSLRQSNKLTLKDVSDKIGKTINSKIYP